MESEKSTHHTNSKNNQTINLRTDFTEFDVSLDRLSTNWNVQNFTELLNKPKVNYLFQIFKIFWSHKKFCFLRF